MSSQLFLFSCFCSFLLFQPIVRVEASKKQKTHQGKNCANLSSQKYLPESRKYSQGSIQSSLNDLLVKLYCRTYHFYFLCKGRSYRVYTFLDICRVYQKHSDSPIKKYHNHEVAHDTQWLNDINICPHQYFIHIYFLQGAYSVPKCVQGILNENMLHRICI